MNYRPDIDGLRAIAVVSVVVHHAFPDALPGGFVGVDIFFVISGYLITTLVRDALDEGRFSLADFYARRARRILPALLVVVTAALVAGWFVQSALQYSMLGKTAAAAAMFVANFSLWQDANYFAWTSRSAILLHLWSLSVEEQFYIFWPLILAALAAFPRLVVPATLAIVGASFYYGLGAAEVDQSRAFYWLPSRVWELGVGGILALLRLRSENLAAPLSLAGSLLGLCVIVVSLFALNGSMLFPGFVALAPTAGAALVIAAGPHNWIARRALGNPLAIFLGLISYPLYLWHWPLLSFAHAMDRADPWIVRAALVAASVPLAWATYRFVEIPVRLRRRVSPQMLAAGLVLVGAAAGAIHLANGLPSRAFAADPRNVFLDHYVDMQKRGLADAYRPECDFYDEASKQARAEIATACLPSANGANWLLWGDSHAQALSAGLRAILPAGASLAQVATSGCPPGLADFPGAPANHFCSRSNLFARDLVSRGGIDRLILAQAEGHEEVDWSAFAAFARRHGVRSVVLVGPAPQWLPSLPRIIVDHRWSRPEKVFVSEGLKASILDADATLARRYAMSTNLTYVSLIAGLCGAQGCRARLDAPGPYNLTSVDYGHLSPEGSLFVARTILRDALEAGEREGGFRGAALRRTFD